MTQLGEENIDLHMDHFINNLLPHVRFPMMTPAQLADLLLNPLSQTHTELLVERIRMAMCYHKNQLELSQGGQVRSSPRLCTFTTFHSKMKYEKRLVKSKRVIYFHRL